MAAGTKIIFEFGTADGKTTRLSYNYGNAEATSASIKGFMNAAIQNKEIFKVQPTSISKAYVQVTTETEFDLSD